MASKARQIPRDLFRFDFRGFFAASALGGAGAGDGRIGAEDLTARALASAGLASLVTLPFLLLLSVLLGVPLAVPAAIGLGYLAVSHAVAGRRRRRADLIGAVVCCGLIGWLLIFLLAGEGPLSRAGLVAALMAPVFAAAPAFARSLLSGREVRLPGEKSHSSLRDAALERAACLDELTPTEQVLVLDADGTILAATAAARKALRMLPDAFEHHLSSLFKSDDLSGMLRALDRCTGGDETIGPDARPDNMNGAARSLRRTASAGATPGFDSMFSRCTDGSIAMRLQERAQENPGTIASVTHSGPRLVIPHISSQRTLPRCDLGEATAFALRHAKKRALAKRIALTSRIEPALAFACDRQLGRRIVSQLVDAALSGSSACGSVHVSARRLKSVVLLRGLSARGEDASEASESDDQFDATLLRTLVEGAGGTLVVDREGEGIALSVRLDLAAERVGVSGTTDRGERVKAA